jgi:hypothetical protein
MLSGGDLSYGREEIMKTYYNFPVPMAPGIFGALKLRYIQQYGIGGSGTR